MNVVLHCYGDFPFVVKHHINLESDARPLLVNEILTVFISYPSTRLFSGKKKKKKKTARILKKKKKKRKKE